MNNDQSNPPTPPELGAELEARIVAWVAGEASAFEAAELERLAAERPEIAIFKRRIAAVQDLVAEALKPDTAPLRLAPERRASLLQAIGAAESSEKVSPIKSPAAPRIAAIWRKQTREPQWILAIAASAAIVVFAFLQFSSSGRFVEKQRQARMDERIAAEVRHKSVSVEMPRLRSEAEDADEEQAPSLVDIPSPSFSRNVVMTPPPPAGVAVTTRAARSAPAFTPTVDGPALPPFEVNAEADLHYYAATTLAGSRIRTDLNDIGSGVTVATQGFLQDAGATDRSSLLAYGAGSGGGTVRGNSAASPAAPGRVSGQDWAAKTGDFQSPVTEATAADKGVSGADATDDEVAKLSAFEVSAPANEQALAMNESVSQGEKEKAEEDVRSRELRQKSAPDILGAIVSVPHSNGEPAKPATRTEPPVAAPVETSTAEESVSTFSLHVSDVSFRLAQAALARGEAPDPAAVRPEEFYNAFDYGDPGPGPAEKISCRIEQSAHPVLQQRNLVRIALRVPATGRGAGQPLRLTVLLDTSGSMEREDRAAAVQRAMSVLVSLLGPNDRITLVGFARQPRLLAEEQPGDQAGALLALIAHTPAEGGTNFEEALTLGAELARRHFDPQAQNRLVLLTDGAANLGNADPAQLARLIDALRQQGIAFDACGVGMDGIDDTMLEALTRKGDGRYCVLDTPESADAGFARQLAGAFRPAAKNVKVQVRFNPARVGRYRLIGFEHHRLKTEDFRNDRVDAAELAAEEAAVALYQVEVLPQGEGELGEVYVRFRDMATDSMVERSWTMTYDPQAPAFDRAAPTMHLAGTAALLAEKLRGGPEADLVKLDELAPVVNALRGRYQQEARVQELVAMFEQMRRLERK